jgi:hypothetical protein
VALVETFDDEMKKRDAQADSICIQDDDANEILSFRKVEANFDKKVTVNVESTPKDGRDLWRRFGREKSWVADEDLKGKIDVVVTQYKETSVYEDVSQDGQDEIMHSEKSSFGGKSLNFVEGESAIDHESPNVGRRRLESLGLDLVQIRPSSGRVEHNYCVKFSTTLSTTDDRTELVLGEVTLALNSSNISKLKYFLAKMPQKEYITDSGKFSAKTLAAQAKKFSPKESSIFEKLFADQDLTEPAKIESLKFQGLSVFLNADNNFDFFRISTKINILKKTNSLTTEFADFSVTYHDSNQSAKNPTTPVKTDLAQSPKPANRKTDDELSILLQKHTILIKINYYNKAADIRFEVNTIDFY